MARIDKLPADLVDFVQALRVRLQFLLKISVLLNFAADIGRIQMAVIFGKLQNRTKQ